MWLKLTRFVIVPVLLVALLISAAVAFVAGAITILIYLRFDRVADYVQSQGFSRPNIPDLPW